MITPNSKISGGRSHMFPATFLARGQINNVSRITRKSGTSGVFFVRLKSFRIVSYDESRLKS